MSDDPTTIDWNLHMTRGHTPVEDWNKRNSLDHYFSAHADEWLVRVAPIFREEVIRLREGIKQLHESIGTMETQGNIAIRKALKELID